MLQMSSITKTVQVLGK